MSEYIEQASAAWKKPVLSKYRESHAFNDFRRLCLIFMRVPIDYPLSPDIEKQIFDDFLTLRNVYKNKGESIEHK